MTTVTVRASDVRVSEDVRKAVDRHDPVTVVVHKRSRYVILHPEDFEFVVTMLERRRQGRPVPVHQLLSDEDFEILAEDRADDGDLLGTGILESWRV